MEKPTKFVLPSPKFGKNEPPKSQPHYLTPSGMTLLTREKQPPPMYGPRGSTIPSKFLAQNASNKPPKEPPKRIFCEPCELELKSEEDFRRHRSQHERCPVDGCKFKGHPKIMDKHVTNLHSSGIFEKVRKLSTPEEIAAWREERRRKYPTLANAKIRQLAQEQRERRGERLGENKARFGRQEDRKRARTSNIRGGDEKKEGENKARFGRQEDKKRARTSNIKGGNEKNGYSKKMRYNDNRKPRNDKLTDLKNTAEKDVSAEKSKDCDKVTVEETDETIVCGIEMFKGTSKLQDYKHEKTKVEKVKNVLSTLVGMYGTDDDDSESDCTVREDEQNLETETKPNLIEQTPFKQVKNETLEENNDNQLASHTGNFEAMDVTEQEDCATALCEIGARNAEPVINELESNADNQLKMLTETDKNVELSEQELLKVKAYVVETPIRNADDHPFISHTEIVQYDAPKEQVACAAKNCDAVTHNDETTNKADKEVTTSINSNESSDEAPEEAPIQRVTTMPVVNLSTSNKAAESNQVETIEAKRLRIEESRRKLREQRTRKLNIRRRELRKQNTMLEKLLEPEIRHERNVLLQCVRFVCENNFFDVGGGGSSNSKEIVIEKSL